MGAASKCLGCSSPIAATSGQDRQLISAARAPRNASCYCCAKQKCHLAPSSGNNFSKKLRAVCGSCTTAPWCSAPCDGKATSVSEDKVFDASQSPYLPAVYIYIVR